MRRKEQLQSFEKLLDILDILRVQCPWDAKQTNLSLRPNTIEEVYELSDALLRSDVEDIKKELGDVLLHVLFYAKIGDEQGAFDLKDVCDKLVDKLIFRHPHIFGDTKVKDAHEVEQNWEAIKLKEKGGNKTVLAGVPRSLPSMIKAYRIQEKVSNVGFDWEDRSDIWAKISEELQELREVIEGEESNARREEEFGDLLFSLINMGRLYGVDPDTSLERTNNKFTKRFNYVEAKAQENGQQLRSLSLEQLENYYREAKINERRDTMPYDE